MDQTSTVAAISSLAMFPVCERMSETYQVLVTSMGSCVPVIQKRGDLESTEVHSNMAVGHGCNFCLLHP